MGADQTLKKGKVVEAVIVSERPSLVFEVLLPTQQKVLAHLVSVVERNFVRLVPGDRVELELSPNDPTRGRILKKVDVTEPRP